MNDNFQSLLSRLDGVKPAGPDRWRSYCPVHQIAPHRAGRGRSLTIALGDGGRTLINCKSCCSAHDIVTVVGLDLSALFPAHGAGHFARGNGGPNYWAGAAGAADALCDAAIDLVTGGGSVFEVMERTSAFKKVARAAMRTEAAVRKGAAHG